MTGFWIAFALSVLSGSGDGAKVLFVAPSPAVSHYQMLDPLILNLARRGHQVTVLSHFPQKEKVGNVTDIDLRGAIPQYNLNFSSWALMDDILELFPWGVEQCKKYKTIDVVKKFIDAPEKFDLMFIEAFESDCFLGLVAKHKVPFIVFSAMSLPIWEADWIYNPAEVSYVADHLCRLGGRMNWWKKVQNVACSLLYRGMYWYYSAQTVGVVREVFDVDLNTLEGVKRNVSFVFVNSFHGITGVRPMLPNVLEIGGIHIKPPRSLPHELESFLRGAEEGAVVISMGSIVKTHTMDPETRKGFISAISRLKERVLWKWEVGLPDLPRNVMTVRWLPQFEVLGHPNVKLFVSHGGIHGLYEAIHHGVPVVGIPLFGDQMGNLRALEQHGVAVIIEFSELNEKTLWTAMNKILGDQSYKTNAERLSRIFHDQPQSPLDRATFWTEYVIRHGGASHLRSGATELSWLQYTLLDVLLICLAFCIFLVALFHCSLKYLRII